MTITVIVICLDLEMDITHNLEIKFLPVNGTKKKKENLLAINFNSQKQDYQQMKHLIKHHSTLLSTFLNMVHVIYKWYLDFSGNQTLGTLEGNLSHCCPMSTLLLLLLSILSFYFV